METSDLLRLARDAREKAYAPYSDFKVGAALLARNGQVFTGCNIENASYGDAICAEKVALIKAISEGISDFSKLVVLTDTEKPASPCGSCRQIFFEFNSDLLVIMANLKGEMIEIAISDLLPHAFLLKDRDKML